ncbi:hypothetical protein NM688_g8702 [Phlebia brevispora]|uniref:Uncharacterized protein n=1 Tax=Phlebia brevispora TaxID=194682 RepID=A0ACC1RT75_9APHY|nr:hypothetical protein NM688_g8702 [Phlebia brevispora]
MLSNLLSSRKHNRSRSYYQQEPADPQKMEQSYSRSVTIVYWHKAGSEPIRIRKEVQTFPWFQLSQCSDIVNEVGLSQNTYVDSYNPNASTWEQETITAVRCVDSEQRLLYRSRKSLLEGMTDRDCLGLEHEIKLQIPSVQTTARKRSITDTSSSEGSTHPNKQYKMTHVFSSEPGQAHVFPQSLSAPVQSPTLDHSGAAGVMPGSPYLTHDHQPGTSAEANGDAFTPHPPVKRWPNDYAVCEIAAGLSKMDELVNQTPSLTQKAAFERVFGCRYVKSTVCRHRGVWRKADKALRESYERMGTDERALWGEFVKRTDFRRDKNAKMPMHDQVHEHDGEDQQQHHQQHHQLDYPMGAAMGMGLGLVDPGVALGVNGGMDDGMNDNQSSLGGLGPQA